MELWMDFCNVTGVLLHVLCVFSCLSLREGETEREKNHRDIKVQNATRQHKNDFPGGRNGPNIKFCFY